jgi:glyoxylase-like metal-dependent hydrolase (beta-lactamase superfamily II)
MDTPTADELIQVASSLFIWQSYDPAIKADLFSTALLTGSGIWVVDPIALHHSQLDRLQQHGRIAAIVVTNANHHRAAIWYSKEFSVPIFAAGETFPSDIPERFTQVENACAIQDDEIEVLEIEGAVAGEMALYHESDGGTLILGDALINFEPHGFTFLPRTYCRNQKQMRQSLRKLLDRKVSRIFFAHGIPILSNANKRLRQLLDADLSSST